MQELHKSLLLNKKYAQFLSNEHVMKIFFALNAKKRDQYDALFVGGCVRNAALGVETTDIDIATRLNPGQVIDILSKNHIKCIETGIDHGTITALHKKTRVEITTLRKDIAPDGRRSDVAFTQDWVLDAQRRDFTINTLLADDQGHVYDPLDVGLNDLNKGIIRFVGDPTQRILEDHLRILRFFRFFGYYGSAEPLKDDLAACAAQAKHIKSLSKERITQEVLKTLLAPKAASALTLMHRNKILPELLSNYNNDIFERFITCQSIYKRANALTRLRALNCKTDLLVDFLSLSKKQSHEISSFDKALKELQALARPLDLPDLVKAAYYHGVESIVQVAFFLNAKNILEFNEKDIVYLIEWKRPSFPLSGNILKRHGFVQGEALGLALQKAEKWWVEKEFTPSKNECLSFIDKNLP